MVHGVYVIFVLTENLKPDFTTLIGKLSVFLPQQEHGI